MDDPNSIEANKVFVNMLQHTIEKTEQRNFVRVSDGVIDRLSKAHHDCYQRHALKDPRSKVAVNCRKRDDMTCIVYQFTHTVSSSQPEGISDVKTMDTPYPADGTIV